MSGSPSSPARICIVGGGATGLSLLWALRSQTASAGAQVTLLHDQADMKTYRSGVTIPALGGHSATIGIDLEGTTVGVDLGVQFVCNLIYPNLEQMLALPDFKEVILDEFPGLDLGVTFNPQINWGNFPAYQRGPLFQFYQQPHVQADMARFTLDVDIDVPSLTKTLSTFFTEQAAKGTPYSSDFIDYVLFPYLSILNGYGGTNLLMETTLGELTPLFLPVAKLWGLPGPLASFEKPGLGWQRFRGGSTTWIDAMAKFASGTASIRTGAFVNAVYPTPGGGTLTVVWSQNGSQHPAAQFDAVVLTTDMDTNSAILDNPNNGYWQTQAKVLKQFDLKPGSCFIHTDDGVFPSYLTQRASTVDFCAAFASAEPGQTPPYDIAHTYSTYNIKNMVPGTPDNLYLSMYGHDQPQHGPDPAKTYASATWKHGSFLGPQLRQAASQLHKIQGLGNVWFAGNNTSLDSEEGALISAMVIAQKLFPSWKYPFGGSLAADLVYTLIRDELMFPASSTSASRSSILARAFALLRRGESG